MDVDGDARVATPAGGTIAGLYAAGELVGGLYYTNYAGGAGLMSGAVFGRRAGINAAAATSCRLLGQYAREDGQPEAARQFLTQAKTIAEKILQAFPDDAYTNGELAVIRQEFSKLDAGKG